MRSSITAAVLALISLDALAGVTTVPEPGALPLFAIGAVGGLAIWMRNRRRK